MNLKNTLHTASTQTLFDVNGMRGVYESYGSFVRAHPLANRSILLLEAVSGLALDAVPDDYSAYLHRGKMTTNTIIKATWDGDDEDGGFSDAATE